MRQRIVPVAQLDVGNNFPRLMGHFTAFLFLPGTYPTKIRQVRNQVFRVNNFSQGKSDWCTVNSLPPRTSRLSVAEGPSVVFGVSSSDGQFLGVIYCTLHIVSVHSVTISKFLKTHFTFSKPIFNFC